jgi:hypothetical protein
MRKFLLFIPVLVAVTFYNSCTKDKAQRPVPLLCDSVNAATNTYNLRIKTIVDTYCGDQPACHAALNYVFLGGGIPIHDYATAKDVFQNGRGLCSIKHEQGCKLMPDSPYPKLADSLITYIQCWAESGYPQ